MATTIQRMRQTVHWTSGINVIAGLWLIIAPFVLSYGSQVEAAGVEGAVGGAQTAMWNDIVVGVVILVLGVWSALKSRGRTV